MCKDQESIQSITTSDPEYQWESDKLTVRHHKREPQTISTRLNAVGRNYARCQVQGHSDPIIVWDTSLSKVASSSQIWDS